VQPIGVSAETIAERFPKLNDDQRRMVEAVLNTTDRIYGIGGKAGVGKTTALRAVRELIDPNTYRTHGLGATSQAILGLKDAGIESETVQRFLMRGGRIDGADERPVIFFVDESSLVSARQLHAITQAIRPMDRLVVVGDERQHDSVEAGRIFQELADAGMGVARLDKIVRQRDETLKEIVTDLSKGQVVAAVRKLEETDRITQVPHRARRFEAIAADYAAQSDGTLVISPDNRSRQELNAAIRQALRASGQLGEDAAEVTILVNRSNVTGPDRGLARTYRPDDVVLYRRRSTILGIEAGTFARVVAVNGSENLVSVEFENGRAVTYDPGRFMGVSIYEQETRKLARGDRIQFTAPDRQRRLYTRDLATVQTVDPAGNIQARLDRTGRLVKFNVRDNRLFDWSYAMTSHSSQGATVNRVLAHIDVGDSRVRNLLNETLAYVATSRAVHDLRIYTDNSHELARVLSRVNRNTVALSPAEIRSYHKQSVQMRKEIEKENAYDTGYAVTI
jgi:ATP-dependent exoDNAse (exonuclease V) alpha subunit